jgi:hypothetical protein
MTRLDVMEIKLRPAAMFKGKGTTEHCMLDSWYFKLDIMANMIELRCMMEITNTI